MNTRNKKVIIIPYPAQGHVTPMLKLASLLSTFGYKPVIITPDFIHRRIASQIEPHNRILSLSIPDGLDEDAPRDFFAIEMAMEQNMPPYLEQIVWKIEKDDGVCCLVVDLLASWAIDVGRRCGVQVAGFWPAMLATYRLVEAIPHLIQTGIISENGLPRSQSAPIYLSPNDPPFRASDLPWLIGTSTARISRFKFWTRTLQRSNSLHWLLTNTFPDQNDVIKSQNLITQVVEIGSLITQTTTISNVTSFWEEDMSCLNWLDEQEPGSVVYISFGSWVSPIGEAKVTSLALALEASRRPFLWVLGPTWRTGLPEGYLKRITTRGKIVSWAPQMEVLRHHAVGCYFTHCGWNSTTEGIQCKKPFICYPIAGDQFVNCAYIVEAWKVGVKLEAFGDEQVENGIRRVMETEEVSRMMERLHERMLGKEGTCKAMDNLTMFTQHLHNPIS